MGWNAKAGHASGVKHMAGKEPRRMSGFVSTHPQYWNSIVVNRFVSPNVPPRVKSVLEVVQIVHIFGVILICRALQSEKVTVIDRLRS